MKKRYLLLAGLSLLMGCSSISVKQDYDRSFNFQSLKTFAWQHATQPKTGRPQVDNDLTNGRVRNAVNATLTAKGFTAAAGETDFLVAYFVEFGTKQTPGSISFGVGSGGRGRYGSVGYATAPREYDTAILTLDILDPSTEKMIWRGKADWPVYSGSNPEKAEKLINDAVEGLLKRFPPQK